MAIDYILLKICDSTHSFGMLLQQSINFFISVETRLADIFHNVVTSILFKTPTAKTNTYNSRHLQFALSRWSIAAKWLSTALQLVLSSHSGTDGVVSTCSHLNTYVQICEVDSLVWSEASVEHRRISSEIDGQISSCPSPSVQLIATRTGESPAMLPPYHIECCCNQSILFCEREAWTRVLQATMDNDFLTVLSCRSW